MPKEQIETDRFTIHRETDVDGNILHVEFAFPDGTRLSHDELLGASYVEPDLGQPVRRKWSRHFTTRAQLAGACTVTAAVTLAVAHFLR